MNLNKDSMKESSIEDDEHETFKGLSPDPESNQVVTKIDIITRCCDNNSLIYLSPFLLNDSKQVVDNFLSLITIS